MNAISGIVEEAMFIVNPAGITFRGMDDSHIAVLDVNFPKSSFDLLESETSYFGVKVEDFQTAINAASNGDIVEIKIDSEKIMQIAISGSLSIKYKLRLINKEEINTPIPKSDYKSKLVLNSNTLIRIITNLQNMSEYVTINCNSDEVEFSGKGDVGDAKVNLKKGNPELKELSSSVPSKAAYSLEYMAKIIRDIGKASRVIDLEYSDKNPIRIKFEMPSYTTVNYYLAPTIEN